METPRPHQKSVSSFPRRENMQQDIPKSPLLFYTPVKKPCSQTPFGTSQLQTPTSKLSFLSGRANTHSVGDGGCRTNEDASITRTPFGLLAGKNLNACLFSPSHCTPRPIALPAPFDKLASPSLKGHAKRVLLMLPQLSPARRVPLKQKRSQSTTTEKQLPFVTPKSSRVHNVQFVTPKSSRVDNVLTAAGQNDDGNARQHHDARNVDVNYEKKRVLASTPRQSPFAIPNSSRVEHVLKTDGQNNGVSGGKIMQHHDPDVDHGRAKLDRVEFLNRILASMPQLSSPARRVPLRQKQKQPIKSSSPLHHKEKQQSSNKKPLSETRKTCKSSQRRKKTCQNEAGGLDVKRQAVGSHQKATKKLLKRVPKGKAAGDGTDKAKQKNVDVGGADYTKERYRDGPKHYEDDNGTKQHDHDEGDDDDDDICIGSSDDTDGEKQHGDDKQHDDDTANGVKKHNDDSMKQHNDDDDGGEEAELNACMKQHDDDVDISKDDGI